MTVQTSIPQSQHSFKSTMIEKITAMLDQADAAAETGKHIHEVELLIHEELPKLGKEGEQSRLVAMNYSD